MNRTEIAAFFTMRNKAWKNHDAEALSSSHTENGEIDSPLFGAIKGRNAIRHAYAEWFLIFPDTEYYSEHLLIDGTKAAEFIKLTGTQQRDFCGYPPTGKRMQIQGASLCFLKEGKIEREIRTYDFTGVLLQLGVLKAKPAF